MLNRRVNVEIEEDDEGTTKWYIRVIKEVKEGTCTITFDGFDSSHNIQVAVEEKPSDDIIFL